MSDFNKYVDRILIHEAGYVNHPNDPGGETNFGITWPILRRGIKDGIVSSNNPITTPLTIRTLTKPQAVALYEAYFWKEPKYDQLPSALAFQVFDAGVNHGPGNATRWLQRAVGVADDGRIGPVTLSAVAIALGGDWGMMKLIVEFWEIRQAFYTRLSTFNTFGRGWINRMIGNMKYAREDV